MSNYFSDPKRLKNLFEDVNISTEQIKTARIIFLVYGLVRLVTQIKK